MYISPHPTAPDQVLVDHPDCSDSAHIARYPCGTRRIRESSADLQVDLLKITQVVLAVDESLHFDRPSHGPTLKKVKTMNKIRRRARPQLARRWRQVHRISSFPPPFRHSRIRDQVRVVIRRDTHQGISSCLCRLGHCRGLISCSLAVLAFARYGNPRANCKKCKISTDHDLISPPSMTQKFPRTDSAHRWPEVTQQPGVNVLCELQTRRGSNKAVSEHVLQYHRWHQFGALLAP